MQSADRFDLSGRTFGKLTALKCLEGNRSKAIWECRCECGTFKQVSYHNLTQALTKSCGCARAQAGAKDLSGLSFGRLTAIERTGEKKGSGYVWKCICECGREAFVTANSLLSGNTRSCGCLREQAKREGMRDLAGQRFGRLRAIEPLETRSGGSVVWKCICDCGLEAQFPAKTVLSGKARSCGCLKRENDVLQTKLHYIDGTCVEFLENMGRPRSDNTSGYPGLRAVKGKWQVRITFKKRVYYLGTYADKEEAIRVRKRAEQRLFGEFLDWYYKQFPDRPAAKRKEKAAESGGEDINEE